MVRFLAHILGLDNASGGWYLWWSGFGADVGLLAASVTYARHANCHEHHCWRLGKYHVEGTPYRVCRQHHPDMTR